MSTLPQMPGLLPCPWPSSTLSSRCPSDPSSLTQGTFLTAHTLVSHICRALPRCPLRSTTLCNTVQSCPQFNNLRNQACGVPKWERSCWTWKAGDFLPLKMPPLSNDRRTHCPVTREVCGVLVGSPPVLGCRLRDGHLPADSLSCAHQLVSHQPQTAPPGAQLCCCLTWFLTTGLHLKHLVDFISCGNNTNSVL